MNIFFLKIISIHKSMNDMCVFLPTFSRPKMTSLSWWSWWWSAMICVLFLTRTSLANANTHARAVKRERESRTHKHDRNVFIQIKEKDRYIEFILIGVFFPKMTKYFDWKFPIWCGWMRQIALSLFERKQTCLFPSFNAATQPYVSC